MRYILYLSAWLVLTASSSLFAQSNFPKPVVSPLHTDTLMLTPASTVKSGTRSAGSSLSVSTSSLTTCIGQPASLSLNINANGLGSMLIFSSAQSDSIQTSVQAVSGKTGEYIVTSTPAIVGNYAFSFILIASDTTLTRTISVEAPVCDFSLVSPVYNCTTGAFSFQHIGGDTSAVSYMAVGITGWTESAGPFSLQASCDVDPFTLMARQASTPDVITTFTWDYTATCPANCQTQPTLPPSTTTVIVAQNPCASPDSTLGQPLALLPPLYDCQTGVVVFRPLGGTGGALSFMSPGITGWTSICSINLASFALIADIRDPAIEVDPFMLFVREEQPDGSFLTAQLRWDSKTACQPAFALSGATLPDGAAREAVDKSTVNLGITLLGNPTLSDLIEVLIDGASNEPVSLDVWTIQGQLISQHKTAPSALPVRTTLILGHAAGTYLIQASTPTKRKTIRVVRQ